MLNSTDFIGDNKPWPPLDRDEADRIAEHVLMRKIYNGLHDEIYPRYAAYLADKEGGELKQGRAGNYHIPEPHLWKADRNKGQNRCHPGEARFSDSN
jgi:hypothetical protein